MVLDVSKANLALPSIEGALDAGPVGLQLIAAGYILAFAVALIPAGWLGDRGHRRVLQLGGLALYVVASALSALAPSIDALIVWRILQGVAAGAIMPQNMGIVQNLFQGVDRARAFGYYGVAVSTAIAAGPPIGGLLTTLGGPADGWRFVFAMNVPLGLVLLVLAAVLVPTVPGAASRRRFDGLGLLLVTAVILLVIVPIVLTTGRPGDDPWRWLLVAAAIVPAVGLWRWERRLARLRRDPLLDPALLRLPSFRNGASIALFWFAGTPGVVLALTLFLQLRLGLDPAAAGLMTLPAALASALTAWLASRYVLSHGRVVTILGASLAIAGMGLSLVFGLLLPVDAAPWAIAGAQVVSGLGGGMIISPNHTMTLADVPPDRAGAASSISQLAQRVGNSIGIAASSAVFYGIVFGAVGSLHGATAAEYDRAFAATVLLGVAIVAVVIVLASLDRGRQVRDVRATARVPVPVSQAAGDSGAP